MKFVKRIGMLLLATVAFLSLAGCGHYFPGHGHGFGHYGFHQGMYPGGWHGAHRGDYGTYHRFRR